MRAFRRGFTLIEFMFVITIIAILTAIAIFNYSSAARKSEEGVTKGNLATLRSALGIYFTDHDGAYPTDNLASITNNSHYLTAIPVAHAMPHHGESTLVTAETVPSDTGGWSYNNAGTDPAWGSIRAGCLHQDSIGQVWTAY